jgi:uncharacterized ferritin-like protein (DUF455 family)
MGSAVAIGTKVVRGVTVRDDPAREPCFQVVHLHEDVPDTGAITEEARRQRIHRDYNQEVQTLEIAALCLADYPTAPWELRLELARQCWDEARHAAMCYRRLLEMGGYKGMYPIANLDWTVVAMLDSLVARIAIQHRTFEAGSIDGIQNVDMLREFGDEATADMLEATETDEIPHVRFGNRWVKELTAADPRGVLQVAAAVAWLRRVVEATGGSELKAIPTDPHNRELAGFSSGEIAEVARQERVIVGVAAPAMESAGHE